MWNVFSMYCAECQWQRECRAKLHPQHEDCLRHVFKWNASVSCTLLSTEFLVAYTGQRAAQCALHGENEVETVKQRTCHWVLQISCITGTSIYTSWYLNLLSWAVPISNLRNLMVLFQNPYLYKYIANPCYNEITLFEVSMTSTAMHAI